MSSSQSGTVGRSSGQYWMIAGVLAWSVALAGCSAIIDVLTEKTKVKVTISWPALSQSLPQKAILAPGSARVAVIRLTGAAIGGGDFEFSVDRPSDTAAVVKSYESSAQALPGTYPLWIGFCTSSGEVMGSPVGEAYDVVALNSDGTGIADIAVEGTVARVEVQTGQSVRVGEIKSLAYTVRNGAGALLAVAPSSVFWGVTEGGQYLEFESA